MSGLPRRATRTVSNLLAAAALSIVAGGLGSTACSRESRPRGTSTATTPSRGGTLRLATFTDLRSLDPAVAMDTEAHPFVNLLFDGLVDYDDEGKIVPQLAERWERSDDGRTFRFFLKRGVQMHDGNELTADDVKRSIERSLHPDTPNPAVSFYDHLDGLAEYQARKEPHLRGVVVEAPHIVAFHLTGPDATFLAVLALPFLRPVCRSGGTRYDDQFQTQPCGAGAFRFDAWQPGRHLKLRRFDGYHRTNAAWLDGIEVRFDVARLTQRFQFERGEIDAILNEFERPGAIMFRTHPEWSKLLRQSPIPEVYADFMNVELPPFDDVRVRQAVASALNRPNLQRYYEGWTQVTGHLLPPGIPGHELHPPYEQTYDLARARRLMAEAGWPYDASSGKGGYPETIVYHAGEGDSASRYAQLLQYDLAQIGIRIEIKEASFPQYQAVVGRPRQAKMGYAGWLLDFADPSDFFEPIFHSKSIAPEDSQNRAFYRSPKLDALLDAAHAELDETKRLAMYKDAERIVCDDAPWSYTYYPLKLEITQPWVRDYRAHPIWNRHFRPVWIDEAARRSALALVGLHRGGAALGALFQSPRGPSTRWPNASSSP